MFSRFPEVLSLRIGCWNINGFNSKSLGNKFQQSEVLDIINKHDIFGIVETHADSNSDLQIHDFRHYVKHRENSKGKRNSGGIAVYIRKTIIGGTTFVISRNKNTLWIKLDKSFFDLGKDLYLGTVYISLDQMARFDGEIIDLLRADLPERKKRFPSCAGAETFGPDLNI